ncbi:MAG: ATP-binding cassette domain-containing protein [Myxococcota bacterium]
MTLSVSGLSVRLNERLILDDVTFESHPGEITAIIGPPASGKTVLLKTIAGLVEGFSGSVKHHAATLDPISPTAWHAGVGMAFQNDALFDAMTVLENVAFPLHRGGVSDAVERARALLERVGLGHATEKLPSEISGGMRRRCGIARAAVTRPAIGLFDDPSAGLDPETSDQIFELIREQAQDSVCLIVSNELPSLLAVADRVMMLNRGGVVFLGTPEDIGRSHEPTVYQFVRGEIEGPL